MLDLRRLFRGSAPVAAPQTASDPNRVPLPAGADPVRDAAKIRARIAEQRPDATVQTVVPGETGGWVAVLGEPVARPLAERWRLGEVKPADAERIDALARDRGLALVEFRPFDRQAIVAALDPHALELRTRIAAQLGKPPWEIDVTVIWARDETDGAWRIDAVKIGRTPSFATADRRSNAWRELIPAAIPGGSEGWTVADDPIASTVTLKFGRPPALPTVVVGRDLLPTTVDPSRRSRLVYGVTPDGTPAVIDLKAGPHTLVVGGTGSGKSTCTRIILMAAYAAGFEVVMVDPTKRFAGLRNMDRYAKGVFTKSKEEAARVLETVYAEVQRRVDLIEQYRVEDWTQLPEDVRPRPWLVAIDEYAGLVAAKIAKPALRDDPSMDLWAAEQTAITAINNMVSAMAAEARSAGVHLVLISQSAYTSMLPGQARLNFGTVIQLVPPARPPASTLLTMVFAAADVPAAAEEIARFNDRRSPGMAVAAIDGVGVSAVRVGYIPVAPADHSTGTPALTTDADYLAEIGVPDGVPLQLPPTFDDPVVMQAMQAAGVDPATAGRIAIDPEDNLW